MRRVVSVVPALLLWASLSQAHGLLIPVEKALPPLALLNHQVTIDLQDQVATTRVEQTFRNHTDRALEATYLFPVPKGASVQKFTMFVDGKEVTGELVEAAKAKQVYTDIVRRTQDPGLLEYMGNNLFRVRVFPVPAKGDLKMSLRYTAVAPQDNHVVEYVYPLKTDGKAASTLEKFTLQATIKSQQPLQNVYSPSHAVTVSRTNDHEAVVHFERDQASLDKDFQLFYGVGDQDVGLTALAHRPVSGEDGYVLLLISPRLEMSKAAEVPRDVVLVLDTSGSMRGPKMEQARKALKYCLDNLGEKDRFGLIHFATTVNEYRPGLLDNNKEQVEQAKKWVDNLEATGGTAINDALAAALALRGNDSGRTFTVVFFTDGQPTIGETDPDKILKNVGSKNTASTRIFPFGVGDNVNATLLDQLADQSRAVSTFVRPAEDIEAKVSGLYSKISHPVLADLKLSAGPGVSLVDVYPPQLPDLFAGGQLVVLARYSGQGPAALKLTGTVGSESREFVYETTFPGKTGEEQSFVEQLWGRRKVGYLLDQIRANGEKKELVDEVVSLAKKYAIATPYTSYLIVPDAPTPVARGGMAGGASLLRNGSEVPPGLIQYAPSGAPEAPQRVLDFAKNNQAKPGELSASRGRYEDEEGRKLAENGKGEGKAKEMEAYRYAYEKKNVYDQARESLARRDQNNVQAGRLGVDLSIHMNNLRNQNQVEQTAQRLVYGRSCLEIGGVWIDDQFDPKMPVLVIKAMSDAYFRILELHPQVKEVFQLGNHLVWVTPNGTALVIDTNDGKDQLADAEISQLFVARK